MTLRITGTQDHALLALVARETAEILDRRGGYLGRTAFQKIVYLLQVRGVPMRYRFDIHFYGPYCDEISRDIEWLVADGVLADHSPHERYSNYVAADNADELIAAHPNLAPHTRTVGEIVTALLPLEPDRLELMATLHFAYRQLKASGRGTPSRDAVRSRLRALKGEKFQEAQIEDAIDRLSTIGILD
ncbi:MAG: hypothetical protein KY476_07035 [Planctomycetes bacterium]|nr:hypothetical protein [Planctomycetota bacterium]